MNGDRAEKGRQIGCVTNLLQKLCRDKVKGSITIHFDGGGNIGKVIDLNLKEWRDNYSSVKVARQIEDEELGEILNHARTGSKD
jgi:hypothetical protein